MHVPYNNINILFFLLAACIGSPLLAMDTSTKEESTIALVEAVTSACYSRQEITTDTINHIEQLLKKGADANCANQETHNKPLLCVPAQTRRTAIAQLLLNHGALIDHGDDWTPLEYAVFDDHIPMVTLLLERKADIQKSSNVFYFSTGGDISDADLISLLLRHPHVHAYDLEPVYSRVHNPAPQSPDAMHRNKLTKARWLISYADKQARAHAINAFAQEYDLQGAITPYLSQTIAAYACCYHHIEPQPCSSLMIEQAWFDVDPQDTIAWKARELIAQYAAYRHPIQSQPLPKGKPKSRKDKEALVKITAMIPTSERINACVLAQQ